VIEIVKTALNLMRRDPKPAFLRFGVYRFLEHVGSNTDYHIGYRAKPTDDELRDRDPLLKYERYLRGRGVSEVRIQEIRAQIEHQIETSIAKARTAPFPTEADLYKGVFA
jgi:TPP-dependent pyruvate/acetoin dehydrogenase alpha subunit